MAQRMTFADMNIGKFINHIITFDNIDDILNSCNTQAEKGFIFERLFDIIIKFNACDLFKNSEYYHMMGNSNNGKLKILKNFIHYLDTKVISSNSSGCSDITLLNKNNGTYIFISSKFPKSDDDVDGLKSVKYYDVQDIIAMVCDNVKTVQLNFMTFYFLKSV